jgi:hypothetical protein
MKEKWLTKIAAPTSEFSFQKSNQKKSKKKKKNTIHNNFRHSTMAVPAD